MNQEEGATGSSNWDEVLSTELCLGFKSGEGHLICHRQSESVFDELFKRIANLYPEFKEQDAEQICQSGRFQVQCDNIFEELGPSVWEGPGVSWLIKESKYRNYGKGTSANLYWNTVDNEDMRGMRYYLHELIGLYLANAQLNAFSVVYVCPHGGPAVELGTPHTGTLEQSFSETTSTERRNPLSEASSVAATVKDSARHRKKPQRYDEDESKQQKKPAKAGRKRTLDGSFRSQRHDTRERSSEQTTLVADRIYEHPRPVPKYKPARKSAPSVPSFMTQRRSGTDEDSLYGSESPHRRKSSKGVASGRSALRSPVAGTATSGYGAPVRPSTPNSFLPADDTLSGAGAAPTPESAISGSGDPVLQGTKSPVSPDGDAVTGAGANEAAEAVPVTATTDCDNGLNDIDEDDDEPEPPIKQESQLKPGDTLGNSIVLSDDEDDTFQRSKEQRSSNATPSLSALDIAGSSELQSSNGDVFEGRRARVSWGPKAPFDDIMALAGCSDSGILMQRVEAIKHKRQAVRNDRIAAAGVKFDGGTCFRILWEDADPAFEEMLELVQDAKGGQKFDLRFEIEWEHGEEDKSVKVEGS